MKRILGVALLLLIGVLAAVAATYHPGIHNVFYAAPVVLPAQKIVLLSSLREEYYKIDQWLNAATDLSSFVSEGQTLIFPEGGSSPAVYKNRTTDIDSVEVEETVAEVPLDYYDSQNYKMRNINLHALPYDKIAYYTKKSAEAIIKQETKDAAYQFAPINAGAKRIIIPTTGVADGAYKSLTLDDIIAYAKACDLMEFPDDNRNLVLSPSMWWQLIKNNDILKAQLQYQANTGVIAPKQVEYYGVKLNKSFGENASVAYNVDTATKAAQGAIPAGDIVPASFGFVGTEVFRAGGTFDMYMLAKENNPTGRADEFGFSHRFKADFDKTNQRYSSMIYAAKV